jgi:hypothetical protein
MRSGTAEPGIWSGVTPGCNLCEPAQVMGPPSGMAGTLLGVGQAGVGHAQQRSLRLLHQVDLDQAGSGGHFLAAVPATTSRNEPRAKRAPVTLTR